jgi:uncharacterized protein
MSFFGADFWASIKGWQYPVEKQMGFWRGLGLFVGLFVLFQAFQALTGGAVFSLLYGGTVKTFIFMITAGKVFPDFAPNGEELPIFLKSVMIGLFPAAVATVLIGRKVSRFGLAQSQGRLPLRWPRFGFVGWLIVVGAFIISMALLSKGLYWAFNVEPAKELGLIEKQMIEWAKDTKFLVLVMPSIALGAPLSEEFLFRGVLFSALTNTRVGRIGAVIISSALWAAVHLPTAPLINVGLIFLMGLVLGALLLRSGSLWTTMACHAGWNSLVSLSLLGLGGQP